MCLERIPQIAHSASEVDVAATKAKTTKAKSKPAKKTSATTKSAKPARPARALTPKAKSATAKTTKIKVRDLQKGQTVRVDTRKGAKIGQVIDITLGKGDGGEPAYWVTVGRANGGFIDSMHA